MNQRENLLRLVRGESDRVKIVPINFGDDIGQGLVVEESEVRKLMREGQEDLLMFGTRPETREEVLRENPCLVRQEEGRFVAMNTDREGSVYIVL